MQKKIILCLCILICAAAAAKENLAVLPFSGGAREGDGEAIAELLFVNRELAGEFSIIPRTSIARAIEAEQRFQTSTGMTDPDTIADIGKQLGANYMMTGNITRLGNRNLLIISILKIDELRQIAGGFQTYTRIENIQDTLPGMVRNIIEAVRLDSSRRGLSQLEKLAVQPVEMGGNIDSSVADTLAQILSIYLIQSGKYLVYPRTAAALKEIEAEYAAQSSDMTADDQGVSIGRGDNPRLVLKVAARRLGDRNMFNASIMYLETGVLEIGGSVNYANLDDGVAAMETLSRELTGYPPDRRRSVGTALGYGALNLAAGLGSFIQRDWAGGATLLAGYGAAAGLIIWEMSMDYEDNLAGIPGTAGLGVAGLTAVYGFIRPMMYQRNREAAEIAERVQFAFVPDTRGGKALRLSYTLRF
jgi:hypothetical protein